ncbi:MULTISPECIES: hypothetical protein [unclassified Halomonas]|uniref:hypothetical protein n=1 Tax=unclassified Halomonas TaxID=2609666 RepID=UPI0005FA1611|nr:MULTISPECIES: hypothetical protein [unclassified Halomonas]KJZ04276.1 hypothetical protein TW86_22365 [Halomonas sp. S2151]MCO7216521.1 hypothetical protein [Halomonas sp. OfavH-34-E]
MKKKHAPYYRDYSEAHRTFHDVTSETAGLRIKDKLNGFVPEDLVEKLEEERKLLAEIKSLTPSDGEALIEKIISAAEENGAVVEKKVENEIPRDGQPARRYIIAKFFDSSTLMARMSLWIGDQYARIYFEAVRKNTRAGEDGEGLS